MSQNTFLWHDFETFGADPKRDYPVQFAALRTDEHLEAVDEPLVIYCQPPRDRLPHPEACLITGISPQYAETHGKPERLFAHHVHDAMSQAGTCTVGYNNFRFDDEVTRHLFWRNFYDPYAREYANGNSRFDLIDLLRMTRALRPDGLIWATREDGLPSFRLEDLARVNGIDTSRAHDALADVEATLGLARLVLQHQPRLWEWALSLRDKTTANALLAKGEPLVHSSARLPAALGATSLVLPFARHPRFQGQWLVWDLRHDPAAFAKLDEDTLADCLWTPSADLPPDIQRLPIKAIRSNRCPMIAPQAVIDQTGAQRIALDLTLAERHRARLERDSSLIDRLSRLFAPSDAPSVNEIDPELDLYGRFAPRDDQRLYPQIRAADGEQLTHMPAPFSDERLNELLLRYRARHWPESLSEDEVTQWQQHRHRRLVSDPALASIQWPAYRETLQRLFIERPEKHALLTELATWPAELGLNEQSST